MIAGLCGRAVFLSEGGIGHEQRHLAEVAWFNVGYD
jgi:hypothetical protein